MLNRPLPAPARDVALLIGRVVLGVVLFAHGWQKLVTNGITNTYGLFEKLGIPLAIVSASFAAVVEVAGGVLLVVGALTTVVVALDLVVMVGAIGFVHITHGIFAQDGGWELVGVIIAAELALAAAGPGRFSVDHWVRAHRAREDAALHRRVPAARPHVTDVFAPAPAGSSVETTAPALPARTPAATQAPVASSAVYRTLVRRAAARTGEPAPLGTASAAPLDFSPNTTAIPVTRLPEDVESAEYEPGHTEAIPVVVLPGDGEDLPRRTRRSDAADTAGPRV